MQSFPIFVINLPTAVERRVAIEKQLNSLGAKFEIMDGVFGNDARVTERYDEELAIKEHGKPLGTGEKGCALAHTLVYERMVRENIPFALILEDDIVLAPDILARAEKEISRPNRQWDWLSFDYRYVGIKFIYHWLLATYKTILARPIFFFYAFAKMFYMLPLASLEGLRNKLALVYPRFSGARRFYRPLYNAGAYIISLEGAKKLLVFTKPLRLAADEIPNYARFRTDFKLFGYVPLCVRQNTDEFATDAGRTNSDWERLFQAMEK